jgi:hypothetical protein
MGMKDRSLIDNINPTFIALTATAIHHCLSGWKTGEFRVSPEIGTGGRAQHKCDTRNIIQVVNNAWTDVFRRLDADIHSSLPVVQPKGLDNILSMSRRWIHSTGTDPARAQLHNDKGRFHEDFLAYIPEELIEQPDNSCNPLSSLVAATEASMPFSAGLPAIASSSQPVPCSNSNSNNNDITNMTGIENMGLVHGSTIVEGAMSLGG